MAFRKVPGSDPQLEGEITMSEDQMKIAHGSQRLVLAINKKFHTELTRSSLRETGILELLWLDPGILVTMEWKDDDLKIGWVQPSNPSTWYLENVWKKLEEVFKELGQFEGVVKRGS